MAKSDEQLRDEDEAFWEGAAASGFGLQTARRALVISTLATVIALVALVVVLAAWLKG